MSMSKELGFHLPEDIVVRILIRLPVKSLVRFSCVSKHWRSVIISDPKFAKSHLQLASQQRTLCRRFLISTYPIPYEDSYNSTLHSRFQSLEDNFNAASVRNLIFPSEEHSQHALASCNGLVLLCQACPGSLRNYKRLSIWNPATGFLRKIPCPSFKTGNINYGFGYVSAIDDYILAFVETSQGTGASRCVEVHLFSLTANFRLAGGQGTLSNGAFHWVNYGSGLSDSAVYAFDLAVEEFRQVPCTASFSPKRGLPCGTSIENTGSFGGCLCLQFGKWLSEHCQIWAMTEYGVPESWVKLFQFNNHDLRDVFLSCHCWDPCYVMNIDTVVIMLFYTKELVMIE